MGFLDTLDTGPSIPTTTPPAHAEPQRMEVWERVTEKMEEEQPHRFMTRRKRRRLEAEEERKRDIAAITMRWTTPQTIVVHNPRGNTGKTTASILLSAAFGALGGQSVILLDANPRGNCAQRLEAPPQFRFNDILDAAPSLRTSDAIARIPAFATHQPEGRFDAIPGMNTEFVEHDGDTEIGRATITSDEFNLVWETLMRIYPLMVVDTGNNFDAPTISALDKATALVIPVSWHKDNLDPAIKLLRDLDTDHRFRDLGAKAVVVNMERIAEGIDQKRADLYGTAFEESGHTVVTIPCDPEIGARDKITWSRLMPDTQDGALKLAAAVSHRLGTGR